MLYERFVARRIQDSLTDTPVTLIRGARQCGKSTLAKLIGDALQPPATYFTLDRVSTADALRQAGPAFFEPYRDRTIVIDEVQRNPEIFLHVKVSVDELRQPGRFILTGSADPLQMPNLGDSLAGRMAIIELHPLSQDELVGQPSQFIDALFSNDFRPQAKADGQLLSRLVKGGYPEAVERNDDERRMQWFENYVNILVDRDARNIQNIQQPADLERLLRMLAAQSASLLNYSSLARTLGLPNATLKSYFTLLHKLLIVTTLPAWFVNASSRITKSPKSYLCDTGLMTYLLDQSVERLPLMSSSNQLGGMTETLVVNELLKQMGWNRTRVRPFHFRSHAGNEVDVVLEGPAGRVVGIEVKTTSNPGPRDLNGLRAMREEAGDRFLRGVLLYNGDQVLSYGSDLLAVPISAVWSAHAPTHPTPLSLQTHRR